MDLLKTVAASFDRLVASGAIEQVIDKQVQETVARAVKDALCSHGEFGKDLEKAVKEALRLHGKLDLPSYNDALLKIVQAQVETATNNQIQREVAARLKELLEPAPEKITLSGLVESYIERLKEELSAGCVCYGGERITFLLTDNETRGFKTIYLDKSGKTPGDRCDIQIGLHGLPESLWHKIYYLRFCDQQVETKMFAGPFYGFERHLFQMRAAGTLLEIDCRPERKAEVKARRRTRT